MRLASPGIREEMARQLIRADYEFPDRSELRYVESVPSEGSTFESHGQTWHVDTVDLDTTGGYIVRLSPAGRRGFSKFRNEKR